MSESSNTQIGGLLCARTEELVAVDFDAVDFYPIFNGDQTDYAVETEHCPSCEKREMFLLHPKAGAALLTCASLELKYTGAPDADTEVTVADFLK